jgi:peptide-methionine (R)-S-oxide reductase
MTTRRTFSLAGLAALLGAGVAIPASRSAGPSGKTFEVTRTDAEWRRILSPQAYTVMREHGTEYAFSSPLDKNYAPGRYDCAGCDLPLFPSSTKYDSRTGWPSFWKPFDNAVGTAEDRSFFTVRTEVHCRRCGGHLGHVFDDGPPPTRLRYCMNGVALKFVADPAKPS